ncbi:MAG TPA: membrane protein insertion efficiency factor YidD [Actinomycetota bacterium]
MSSRSIQVPQHTPGEATKGRRLAICLIQSYQRRLAPRLPTTCVYEPTCSQYMVLSIEKHGALRGLWSGVRRIARCRPGRGGYDYP